MLALRPEIARASPGRAPRGALGCSSASAFVLLIAFGASAAGATTTGAVAGDVDGAAAEVVVSEESLPSTDHGRRLGESCFFGAGAGAASTLLASVPLIGQGLGVTGALTVALGAAGIGCTVGFAGAGAASAYHYLWDHGWFGVEPKASNSPPAQPAAPIPEAAP